MSIISRFSDIISANINALLDKAEDPAKMVDQYLRQAMDDLAEVRKETAGVLAEEKRCKRLLDDAKEDVDKYQGLAKKALQAGNEGDARTFLAKKQECEAALASAQTTYDAAHANAQKMRQMHDKLTADVASLQARRNNVKATMAVAKTQKKVNDTASKFSGTHGAVSAFARMEEKAASMLDVASAEADLAAQPEDEATALEAKYGAASSASVDDELAALKAELGM